MLAWLTDTDALSPHGFCLLWHPGLLWLDAASDSAIMLAYFSIPLAMLWFVRHRRDLPHRWIALLFAAFILACGSTHGLDVLTLWVPAYPVQGVVKALTAALSVATAIVLWPQVPKLLALPSHDQLNALNAALLAKVAEQERTAQELRASEHRLLAAQDGLQRANEDLERRVEERTAELTKSVESARRSEARFRSVVEATPNAMVMVNQTGTIELVNARAEAMFGYPRGDMLGRPVEMLLPEGVRAADPAVRDGFFGEPMSSPMAANSSLRAVRRDGRAFEVEIGVSSLETDDGARMLAAVVDISERVRLEEQLRQSQKMEVIGRLAAGVSHDFNNILQVITGGMDMLRDEPALSPGGVQFVDVVDAAARRGSYLTHHLLAYSRKQALTPQRLHLGEIIDSLRTVLSRTLGSRISVVADVGPAVGLVHADRSLLETALMNLAINAAHAMPEGGTLRLEVVAAELDQPVGVLRPGRYVVIAVTDTGTGMSPEVLACVFEPFFTTKGLDGTGLGLAMVQGFTRQSGGDVRVSSTPGKGSCFELWLPEAVGWVRDEAPAEAVDILATGQVLLVDDSPDVLLMIDAYLHSGGFTVRHAKLGAQALAILAAGERFDVLVTDYSMPGMNGVALIRQARAIQPDLPALLISGFADVTDSMIDQQDMALLRKPFRRAELIAEVSKLLRRERHHASGLPTGSAEPSAESLKMNPLSAEIEGQGV